MSDKHRPRWIVAKEPLACELCHKEIKKGEKAFLVPKKKAFYCQGCSKTAAEQAAKIEAAEEAEVDSLR